MSTLPEKWVQKRINLAYVQALESYAKKAAEAIVRGKQRRTNEHGFVRCFHCDGVAFTDHIDHTPDCIVLESQKMLQELK